jgi:hypothetical protein
MKLKTKTIKLLIPTLALLILLAIASPALACKQNPTYTLGSISYPDPNNPGTIAFNGNIETIKGSVSTGTDYGYPWGSDSVRQVTDSVIDLTTLTGTATSCIHKTFHEGNLEITTNNKLTGGGLYTYNGPTFTASGKDAQGNSIPVTIADGAQFIGLLISGTGIGHGTIDHHHVETKETVSGVVISAGPLKGDTLVAGTGMYTITGQGHR